MARVLKHDRAHDYPHLIRRWRSVARKAGLRIEKYAEAGGYDLFHMERTVGDDAPAIYLSAGIHGDEAGATEGLLLWAEKNVALLKNINALIFPCLNPWGLISNCRLDSEGRDLNRSFHDDTIAQIGHHLRKLKGRRFHLAIAMHEDYDAGGAYIYEVPSQKTYWGETMLKAASKIIPADSRRKIEGRAARAGVVRRSIKPDLLPTWPEAFVLHFNNSARTFTVETPSEFFLDDRVTAQVAILSKAVALCREEFRAGRKV